MRELAQGRGNLDKSFKRKEDGYSKSRSRAENKHIPGSKELTLLANAELRKVGNRTIRADPNVDYSQTTMRWMPWKLTREAVITSILCGRYRGRQDGWMDRWIMDGWMDDKRQEGMDAQMDGHLPHVIYSTSISVLLSPKINALYYVLP